MTIARAILKNPSILILDEITSSVDAETERLIRRAVDALIKGRTTFIPSHRLPIITNADLILVIKDGQIVERGKHQELMAGSTLYRQTYLSQLASTQDLRRKPEGGISMYSPGTGGFYGGGQAGQRPGGMAGRLRSSLDAADRDDVLGKVYDLKVIKRCRNTWPG